MMVSVGYLCAVVSAYYVLVLTFFWKNVFRYAIAMALGDKQRVIYTSPIKALSNQKYRELGEEFSVCL